MLTLAGIQAGYSGMQVLFGIDIRVDEGEVVAILGANGAGKSTILRVITGLLHPTAGTVTLRGDPIHHLPPHVIVRRGIVCVPQRRRIFGGQNARAALSVADRGYVLENGRVVLQGAARDVVGNDYVRKTYLAA